MNKIIMSRFYVPVLTCMWLRAYTVVFLCVKTHEKILNAFHTLRCTRVRWSERGLSLQVQRVNSHTHVASSEDGFRSHQELSGERRTSALGHNTSVTWSPCTPCQRPHKSRTTCLFVFIYSFIHQFIYSFLYVILASKSDRVLHQLSFMWNYCVFK